MKERKRRLKVVFLSVVLVLGGVVYEHFNTHAYIAAPPEPSQMQTELASSALGRLDVKGRAPKTGYKRAHYGGDWGEIGGCDVRNLVLKRDLIDIKFHEDGCRVLSGRLNDPYTAATIQFTRGANTSDDVQIDHVVALSDSWQKGAQNFSETRRLEFANDALNLLAVDGETNQKKGDGDAATWLPPNKTYRCRYIARQIAVKAKYQLWVTPAERDAMQRVLHSCPMQRLTAEG